MMKFELDIDTADLITLGNLKRQRKFLKQELKRWKKNPKTDQNPIGYWMHNDDVINSAKLIKALDKIIDYYGG